MIEEIIENKLDYASLLCESDPNINLVENYLRDGRLFAYFEKQTPLAFIVVKEINNRGHGYGKSLLQYIENLYQNKTTFLIGTANSSMTNMLIYTKLGYHYSHKIENFFIDYYPQEIYENNMQAIDLLYFSKTRAN